MRASICRSSSSPRGAAAAAGRRRLPALLLPAATPPRKQLQTNLLAIETLAQLVARSAIARQQPQLTARWLAARLDRLGPTYIKLGQFAAARKDIFGPEVAGELAALLDRATPVPPERMAVALQSVMARFPRVAHIEAEPLATASIGQVHEGRLSDGTRVVVKVKKPDVEQQIRTDLRFLELVARVAPLLSRDARSQAGNKQGLAEVLADVKDNLLAETDFLREASNLRDFYARYSEAPDFAGTVVIPRVYLALSDDSCIVMEYVASAGLRFKSAAEARDFARRLMAFFVRQLLDGGILHGDPHAGNIGTVAAAGRASAGAGGTMIVLYDFGSVVRIDERERFVIKELVYLLIARNKYGVAQLLPQLGVTVLSREGLYQYIDAYIEYMQTIDFTRIRALYQPGAALPFRLEGKVLRIVRAFGIVEGVCKGLDADFNYFALLDTYLETALLDDAFLMHKAGQDAARLSRLPDVLFRSIVPLL
jgi:predicted unusual protein kinase regulating ubiquinone biosynthesis (AarF/ABC1/UbiB family)